MTVEKDHHVIFRFQGYSSFIQLLSRRTLQIKEDRACLGLHPILLHIVPILCILKEHAERNPNQVSRRQ